MDSLDTKKRKALTEFREKFNRSKAKCRQMADNKFFILDQAASLISSLKETEAALKELHRVCEEIKAGKQERES